MLVGCCSYWPSVYSHTLADPASVDLSTQLPAIIRLRLTVVHVVRGEMDEDV